MEHPDEELGGGVPLVERSEMPPSPPPGPSLARITASMVGFKVLSTGGVAVVGVITARQLEPSGRGELVLLLAIASFALLVCSLGINFAGRVHLVAKVHPVSLGEFLGLCLALVGVQVLVCVVLGLTLLPAVDVRLAPFELVLFGVLGAVLLGQYLLNDAINAFGHTTKATAVEAFGSLMQVLLVLAVALAGTRAVQPYVVALIAANGLQVLAGLITLKRLRLDLRPRYERSSWRHLLKTGLPGIPTALGQLLTFRMDRYLVGLFMTPADVGIYSVAATAPEMLRLPALALSQPIFFRLASGKARLREFRRIGTLCVGLTVGVAALMFAVAPVAVRFVFGSEYMGAVTPLRVLLLGEAGITAFYLAGGSLAGVNRIGDAAMASVIGLLVVGLGDVVLIPAFGLIGAAVASVLAYSIMGLMALRMLVRAAARADAEEEQKGSSGCSGPTEGASPSPSS